MSPRNKKTFGGGVGFRAAGSASGPLMQILAPPCGLKGVETKISRAYFQGMEDRPMGDQNGFVGRPRWDAVPHFSLSRRELRAPPQPWSEPPALVGGCESGRAAIEFSWICRQRPQVIQLEPQRRPACLSYSQVLRTRDHFQGRARWIDCGCAERSDVQDGKMFPTRSPCEWAARYD